jgi:hypothetical protein
MPFGKYYIQGSEGYKCVFEWLFSRVFIDISFFSLLPRNPPQKTGRFKKKFHEKIWTQTDFMMKFLNFFSKKKSKIFQNFFFESCSFDAKTSAKKNFFWKKITTQISAKISIFIFAKASCCFKKFRFFLIFSRYL